MASQEPSGRLSGRGADARVLSQTRPGLEHSARSGFHGKSHTQGKRTTSRGALKTSSKGTYERMGAANEAVLGRVSNSVAPIGAGRKSGRRKK